MQTRLLSILLAVLLCLSACSAAPTVEPKSLDPNRTETMAALRAAQRAEISYPLAEAEPLTVMMPANLEIDNTPFLDALEAATGVALDCTFFSAEEYESMGVHTLVRTVEDFPDLLWGISSSYQFDLLSDELLLLNSYLEADAPNYLSWLKSNQNAMGAAVSDNGEVYQFYTFREADSIPIDYGPVVRQDLLDKYGLPLPETYADWENTLRTLRDEVSAPLTLPADAITWSGYLGAGFDVNLALDKGGNYGFYQVDGVVKYGPMEPEFAEAVSLLQGWYQEGLITKTFLDFPNTGSSDYLLKQAGGESAIFYLGYSKLASLEAVSEIDGFACSLLPDPVQEKGGATHLGPGWAEPVIYNGFSVSASCADPARVVRFVDFLYSEEGVELCNFGVEGVTYTRDGKTHTLTDETLVPQYTNLFFAGIYMEERQNLDTAPTLLSASEIWSERKDTTYHLPFELTFMTEAEDEDWGITDMVLDLSAYMNMELLQLIIGERSLDELPAIREELQKRKVEECLGLIQARLDTYYAQ